MIDQETLARKMYDSYCEAVGGKAFNGDTLPNSEEFFSDTAKEKQSNAWRVAAKAAIEYFTNN